LLRAGGQDVAVTPRAFDLLVALVERAGQLVSKNELLELVWPKLVVEENNLQVQISTLRKLLGAQAIATVPGRGYKFTLLPGEVDASPAPGLKGDAPSTGCRRAICQCSCLGCMVAMTTSLRSGDCSSSIA
jgi:hypothetical protein